MLTFGRSAELNEQRSGIGKPLETGQVVEQELRVTANVYGVSFWGVGNILKIRLW